MCVHPHTTLVALHHLLAIVEVDTAWTSHDPGLVSPIVGLRTRGMMCLPSHRTHPPRNNNDSHPLLLFSSNPHSTLHRSRCTAMHPRTHRSLLLLLNPNHRPSLSASLSSLARQQQRFANAESVGKSEARRREQNLMLERTTKNAVYTMTWVAAFYATTTPPTWREESR